MLLCMFFVLLGLAQIRADDECEIQGKNASKETITININDNASGIIGTYTTKGVNHVLFSDNKYIGGSFNNSIINIYLKPAWEHYEEENTMTSIVIIITLTCNLFTFKPTLFVNIADLDEYVPKFSQSKYEFTLPMPLPEGISLEAFMNFEAKDIDITNDNLVFKIDDPNNNFIFSSSSTTDDLRKTFSAHLKTNKYVNIDTNNTYTIKVTDVGNPPKTGTASLKLNVDKKKSVPPNPLFSEPIYKGRINQDNKFSIKDQISLKHNAVTKLYIEGEYSDNFDINNNNGKIEINYMKPIQRDILDNDPYIYLILVAKVDGAIDDGLSILLIDLPGQQASTTTSSTTPTISITTTTTFPPCHSCPICPTNSPITKQTTLEPTTKTSTTTHCPPCPTPSPEPCTTNFPTTKQTTLTSTVTTQTTTHCPLCPTPEPCTTTHTPSSSSTTPHPSSFITTACPPPDCSKCFTTSSGTTSSSHTTQSSTISPSPDYSTTKSSTSGSTICPPCHCSTTTSRPPTPTPSHVHYDQPEKEFDVTPIFIGSLGVISAKSDELENIEYSLATEDDYIKSVISYDKDAQLIVTAKIQTGLYEFTLKAKGIKSGNEDICQVVLKVDSGTPCRNGNYHFAQSLFVKKIPENLEVFDLVIMNDNKYDLQITYEYPENLDLFKINTTTGNLQLIALDREHTSFSSLYKPQVKAILEAREKSSKSSKDGQHRIKRDVKENLEDWVLTSTIDNVPSRLVVTVIIEDENDNSPVFEIEKNPVMIGYPNSDLAKVVAPSYLFKVKATDKDAGINSKITYSTNTIKFVVHPEEGIVSPSKGAFENNEDEEFLVIASDQGNKSLSSNITIKVKVLNKDQLSIITIPNLDYVNIENYMKTLQAKTNITLGYLTATVLPTPEKNSKIIRSSEKPETTMKLVIYALDKDGKPVNSKNLNKLIHETTNVNPQTWKETNENCDNDTSVGWIVSVSILSVLLVASVIAIIVLWIKFVRPRRDIELTSVPSESGFRNVNLFEKRKKNSFQQTPVEEKLNNPIERRATGVDLNFEINGNEIDSGRTTIVKTENDANSAESEDDEIDSTVKFHPEVTEIEIDTTKP